MVVKGWVEEVTRQTRRQCVRWRCKFASQFQNFKSALSEPLDLNHLMKSLDSGPGLQDSSENPGKLWGNFFFKSYPGVT